MPDRIDRRSFLARGMLTASGMAVAGAGAAACSSGGSSGSSGGSGAGSNGISSATPRPGGQLIFGVEAEEQGFDPATGRFDETGVLYARTVFDPLTILASDGSVQPYLAKSVTPNGDYSQWTITTRPGVNFHDGTVCDAAAVAGSIEHFVKGLLGVTLRGIISNISAPASDTVVVTLTQPWVAFPAYLAGGIGGQAGYIIAPSMIANPNGTQNPVGTGPFKFQEWVPNDHFTSVKNPSYWRPGLPYLDSITYRPIVDAQQRADALLAGNIDVMHTDLPASIIQFRSNSSYGYIDDSQHVVGEPDMGFIMLNLQNDVLKDIRVRKAMAMAIDRQQYIRIIDKDVNPTEDQPFVSGTPYYTSDAGYPSYNPTQAKALVQQVAHDTGKPVAFSLSSTTGASTVQAVQFLQNQLQAVGMQVQLTQIQQADLINDALGGAYEAVLWRQFAAVDPDLNYLFWSPTEIFGGIAVNFARNSDPSLETYLQTGRRSTDPATRATAYQQFARQLNQDLPYIWLDRAIWAIVANSKVQNFNNPTTPAGAKAYGMIVGTIWTPQIWLST